jgi:hypothetical protein
MSYIDITNTLHTWGQLDHIFFYFQGQFFIVAIALYNKLSQISLCWFYLVSLILKVFD